MAYLETVENDLPDAVISIYKEISKLPSIKYKKDRKLYEQYFDKINKHNAEVTFIKSTINLWSFKKNLDNPHSLSKYLDDSGIINIIMDCWKGVRTFLS